MGTKSKSLVSKKKKKKSKRRGFKNMLWNSLRRTESVDEMDTDDEHVTIKEVVKDVVDDCDHTDTEDENYSSSANNNNNNVVFQNPSEKKKNKRKRVTIIVEDASDSEYEDDDYNSPWRNRRPSPGQWMEPVESYYE